MVLSVQRFVRFATIKCPFSSNELIHNSIEKFHETESREMMVLEK